MPHRKHWNKEYFIYIVQDKETPVLAYRNPNHVFLREEDANGVILYPGPEATSAASHQYNACFIVNGQMNADLIAIPIGQYTFHTKGLLQEEPDNFAALARRLNEILVEHDIDVPRCIKTYLARQDLQHTLLEYDRPRYENACRWAHEEKLKQDEEASNQAAILRLLAIDAEQMEQKKAADRKLIEEFRARRDALEHAQTNAREVKEVKNEARSGHPDKKSVCSLM